MRRVLRVLVPIIVLAAGAIAASYLARTKERTEPSPATERVWTVETVAVRLADVQPDIHLFGKIFAAREIQVRTLVTGQIVELHPNLVEGGLVRRGELILAIDGFDYRAALKEAESRLGEARGRIVEREAKRLAEMRALESDREIFDVLARDLERAKELSARGNISAQALDHKRLELSRQQRAISLRQNAIDTESARLEQDKAAIEGLDSAVQRARYDLERARVHAPFDGVFHNITAQLGQRVGALDSVATLIDTASLEARFHISDAQYGRLTGTSQGVIGRKARVIWRAGQREVVLDAVVARVAAQIDAARGGVGLFARIEHPGLATSLRPGAFVEVVIPDRIYEGVARVPESVLHPGSIVYGVKDGRLVQRRADIVARIGNEVLLHGELSDGERLVTTRSAAIAPGLRVELR